MAPTSTAIDYAMALARASELVKKAGFSLHHVSLQTETCYYEHQSRPGCFLRLSAHKSKEGAIGLNGIVSRLTLSRKAEPHTERRVLDMTTRAIGKYFLTDPKPSRYDGPRAAPIIAIGGCLNA